MKARELRLQSCRLPASVLWMRRQRPGRNAANLWQLRERDGRGPRAPPCCALELLAALLERPPTLERSRDGDGARRAAPGADVEIVPVAEHEPGCAIARIRA